MFTKRRCLLLDTKSIINTVVFGSSLTFWKLLVCVGVNIVICNLLCQLPCIVAVYDQCSTYYQTISQQQQQQFIFEMSTVQDQNQQLPYSAFPKQSPSISNDISNDSNSNTGIIDISSNIAIDLDDDLPLAQVAAIAQQDQQSSMLMHPELNISQSNAMSTDELREGLKRLDELYEEVI